MSHDSRYETECPHGHGWYFYDDGCAVAGCENAPSSDQDGCSTRTPEFTDAQLNELYLVMRSARRAGKSAPHKAREWFRRQAQ